MKRGTRITLKVITIIVVILIALYFILWAVAAPVTKYVINNYGPDLIGRKMSVEDVSVNLPKGEMTLRGFEIKEADDSTSFVKLNALDFEIAWSKLFSRTIQIEHIHFGELDAQILQNGSEFNFSDIIAFFEGESASEQESESQGKSEIESESSEATSEEDEWSVVLNNISFDKGHIFYHDLELDSKLGLENINLKIPTLYLTSQNSNVALYFTLANGGVLDANLAYNVEEENYWLDMDIDSMNMHILQPYIAPFFNLYDVEGRMNAEVKLDGNLDHLLDFNTKGNVTLVDMSANDAEGNLLTKFQKLQMSIKEMNLMDEHYVFDTLSMQGAYLRVIFDESGNMNLDDIFVEEETEPQSASQAESQSASQPQAESEDVVQPVSESQPSAMTFTVGHLSLSDGVVEYTDHTMRQRFDYKLSELSLRGRNFDLNGSNQIFANARLNDVGRANVVWKGSLSDMTNQRLDINVENVRLVDLSPYCYEYSSYPLTAGNLSFSSSNIVSNNNLSSNNHLDVYRSKAGNKDKTYKAEYSNIPVKLGLYLLKDMNEHIKMDIPVKGRLDSPEFSFRKIVLKAVGNAMLKVVAAPFVLLRGDKSTVKDIPFDPSTYTLTTQQYESLNTIVATLQSKPDLKIRLLPQVDSVGLMQKFERMAIVRDLYNSQITNSTERLSPMDVERMSQLTYTDAELNDYANRRLVECGEAADTVAVLADKCSKLYSLQATRQLEMFSQMRDKSILDYAVRQGAKPEQIEIGEVSAAKKGKSRYVIEINLDGEMVSLGEDSGSEGEGEGETSPQE